MDKTKYYDLKQIFNSSDKIFYIYNPNPKGKARKALQELIDKEKNNDTNN